MSTTTSIRRSFVVTLHLRQQQQFINTIFTTGTGILRVCRQQRQRCAKNSKIITKYYHELAYKTHGKPSSTIQYYQSTTSPTSNDYNSTIDPLDQYHDYDAIFPTFATTNTTWVKVEMIAAPWNPADAFNVLGKYPNPYLNHIYNNDSSNTNQNPFAMIAQRHRCSKFDIDRTSSNNTTETTSDTKRYDQNNNTTSNPKMIVPGSEGWGHIIEIKHISTMPNVDHIPIDSKTLQLQQSQQQQQQGKRRTLQVGDYVTMGQPGLGTLRSHLFWLPQSSVIRINHGQELYDTYGPYIPAPLFQTGGTAYRMIYDYYCSVRGRNITSTHNDTPIILQNAGNSAVGLMMSQIMTNIIKGICISLVRSNNRTAPNAMIELIQYMKEYGTKNASSNLIILPEELIDLEAKGVDWETISNTTNVPISVLQNIHYAYNGVGGTSIQRLLPFLTKDAMIVSYGNMSKESTFPIDPSKLIFHNLQYTGFWYSRWMVQQQYQQYVVQQQQEQQLKQVQQQQQNDTTHNNSSTTTIKDNDNDASDDDDLRTTMMNELVDAVVLNGTIKLPPVQPYPLSQFHNALMSESSSSSNPTKTNTSIRKKLVFDCRE